MDWQPIETAPKDGSAIWAVFRPDIYPTLRPGRPDLERWNGVQVPLRHPGIYQAHGRSWDPDWNIAAPVGNGGFPDDWIAGWMPLPPPPSERDTTEQLVRAAYPTTEPRVGTKARQEWQAARNALARRALSAAAAPSPTDKEG